MQSLVCESIITPTAVLNHVVGKTIFKLALFNVSIDFLNQDDLNRIGAQYQIFAANHLQKLPWTESFSLKNYEFR